MLCKTLAGKDFQALSNFATLGYLPTIFDMACKQDVLPALAVRCAERNINHQFFDKNRAEALKNALRENTLRNMKISAQALKLTNKLNQAGITPLFLKGTARLLQSEEKNLGFRKQIDIDLIVEPKQLRTACEVFLEHDYHFHYDHENAPIMASTKDAISTAVKNSDAHHHLPPLVKSGYDTTVELHKHFLPKRFQGRIQLRPLFTSAVEYSSHNAKFKVPSVDYQIIHIVLGKLVHDGHFAKQSFPIREACDFIELQEEFDLSMERGQVIKKCGNSLPIFHLLVEELMGGKHWEPFQKKYDVSKRLSRMEKRYNSEYMTAFWNAYARSLHLTLSLIHNPKKTATYLRRLRT